MQIRATQRIYSLSKLVSTRISRSNSLVNCVISSIMVLATCVWGFHGQFAFLAADWSSAAKTTSLISTVIRICFPLIIARLPLSLTFRSLTMLLVFLYSCNNIVFYVWTRSYLVVSPLIYFLAGVGMDVLVVMSSRTAILAVRIA